MISCRICSRELTQLTSSHLRPHGITIAEYKAKYPGAMIVSHEVRDKISSANSGNVRTEEHKANLKASVQKSFKEDGRVAHNKGIKGVIKNSAETKAKKRAIHLGAKRSQATKDRMSVANAGRQRSPEAIDKWRLSNALAIEKNGGVGFNKGFKHSQATKDALSAIASARTVADYGPKLTAMWAARKVWVPTDVQRENYRQARLTLMRDHPELVGFKWRDTKPELEFEEELVKHRMTYTKQYHSSKPHYLYDFKIGDDVLVEIDGPYHHNPKMHKTVEDYERQVARDKAKNVAALENGFTLYRIPVGQHLPQDWYDILKQQGWDLF
jgi:very-short-patch-repair endonuclease